MIDNRVLVFPAQRPDPSLPLWLARIEAVGRAARRERALPFGLGIAALGAALLSARLAIGEAELLPDWVPRFVREVAAQSPETLLLIAGVLLLGGCMALAFWHSIGRWTAAYRLQKELYGRYHVRAARVASLGLRVRMGERGLPYRRIRWQLLGSSFSGWSPPVLAELVEVLKPGDTVWIGVDREKTLPPIFLGADQ
jgi:hypothetical protein